MEAWGDAKSVAGGGLNGREVVAGAPQWLRRSLFGYRPADVLTVVSRLADSLDREWRERQLLSQELDRVRSELAAELQEERARRIEAEQQGRLEAAQLLSEAEEQAARLRHEAS